MKESEPLAPPRVPPLVPPQPGSGSEAERFLQSVLNSMDDSIKIIDRDYRVLYVNRAAAQRMGRPAKELQGSRCFDEFENGGAPCTLCTAMRCFDSGRVETHEGEIRSVEAGRRVYEFVAYPLHDERGEVRYVVEVTKDVTGRKRLEEEVVRSAKLAMVGEMAAAMAHEIRNPLSSILTAVNLLLDERGMRTADERKTLAVGLRHETRRLKDLLGNFLAFARPAEPRPDRGDLNRVVEEIVSMIRHDHVLLGSVTIDTDLESDLPELTFDPHQAKQVLWNVLLNALQSLEGQGTVRIRSRREGRGACVSVQDSGRGIPEDVLPRVFDPFYTTKPQGTGLGLSIARRLMEGLGGTATAASPPGRGARIDLHFPGEPLLAACSAHRAEGPLGANPWDRS